MAAAASSCHSGAVADLTSLELTAGRELARDYGIDLARSEPVNGGSVNSNFRWWSEEGRSFFARIYEEQDEDGALREVQLADCLISSQLPVARALQRIDGRRLHSHQGKPVAVFSWVEGTIRCQKSVTTEDCHRVGQALAAVHLIESGLPAIAPGRFEAPNLLERLSHIKSHAKAPLADEAGRIESQLTATLARRAPSLPSGLIHGDLFRDNCLWRG